MMLKIFAVLDTKAGAFAPPFFVANDEVALRSMAAARSDQSSLMAQFPDDFKLFGIGEYDDETGMIRPTSPRLIVEAL